MNLKITLLPLATIGFVLSTLTIARAQVAVSLSAPGVQTTNVAGAITEDFNGSTLSNLVAASGNGYASGTDALGTFTATGSNGLGIIGPNLWGGANTSNFAVVDNEGGVQYTQSATFNFATPESYVGVWWSAIDGGNSLSLYDGSSLLGAYNSSNLGTLSSSYYGNPNTGQDAGEPFAYVNFNTSPGSVITSAVFANSAESGYEFDNISAAPAPETSSIVSLGLMLACSGPLLLAARKRAAIKA